jgi:hypothetical protein
MLGLARALTGERYARIAFSWDGGNGGYKKGVSAAHSGMLYTYMRRWLVMRHTNDSRLGWRLHFLFRLIVIYSSQSRRPDSDLDCLPKDVASS